jgi:hypothetical protein
MAEAQSIGSDLHMRIAIATWNINSVRLSINLVATFIKLASLEFLSLM